MLTLQRVWLVLGWLGVAGIIVVSLIPSPPTIQITSGDKLAHVLAYALVMAWFSQVCRASSSRWRMAALLASLGILLEFAQEWTGYRTFSYADMLANTTGILLGWLLTPPRVPGLLQRLSAAWRP